MSKINDEKLRELCLQGVSNAEIAKELDCDINVVYARRSALGLTIAKCQTGAVKLGKRSSEEIQAEIKKVEGARTDAARRFQRAVDRLVELNRELEEAGS